MPRLSQMPALPTLSSVKQYLNVPGWANRTYVSISSTLMCTQVLGELVKVYPCVTRPESQHLGGLRQEERRYKVSLGHIWSLRPVFDT